MKLIQLTQGMTALVDDEDYGFLNQFLWSPQKANGGKAYAFAWTGHENGGYMTMHRLILKDRAGFVTDHKNGNGLDNRKENLRYATPAQNAWNSKARKSKSGFTGVKKSNETWIACIRHRGIFIQIGTYLSPLAAAVAYDRVAHVLRGEFARLNFPGQEEPQEFRGRILAGINRHELKKNGSTSRFRGVHWSKWMNKWKATMTHEGTQKFIGYYATEEEAAAAFDRAATLYRGKDARLNFSQQNYSAAIDK